MSDDDFIEYSIEACERFQAVQPESQAEREVRAQFFLRRASARMWALRQTRPMDVRKGSGGVYSFTTIDRKTGRPLNEVLRELEATYDSQ